MECLPNVFQSLATNTAEKGVDLRYFLNNELKEGPVIASSRASIALETTRTSQSGNTIQRALLYPGSAVMVVGAFTISQSCFLARL